MRLFAALLAFALASARPAAADEAEETARRMDDRLFFVRGIGGHGWKPFLDDVTRAIGETPAAAATPVRKVRDQGAAEYSAICVGRKTVAGRDEAYDWYRTLAKDAVDTGSRPEYARRGAEIDVTRAQDLVTLGRDEDARAALVRGLELSPGYVPALDALTAVVLRQADVLSAEGREDYDGAVRALDDGVAHLPADSGGAKRIAERRRTILATTGTVAVEWLGDAQALGQVPGARTDYRTASLVFRPEPEEPGAKGPPPRPLAEGKPVRVRHGQFRVVARAEGGTDQDGGVVEVGPADAVVALVTVVPDGMVVVRSPSPHDWFLADRTEVSNADYRRETGRSAGRDDRAPAMGVSFAEAQAYATKVRKRLPTREQWWIAAFGTPKPAEGRFPWGTTAPVPGRHFVGGAEGPGPVDGCPDGASPFKILNMAGNAWEWLADGWVIGGGWKNSQLSVELFDQKDQVQTFHLLLEPAPTDAIYRTLPEADQIRYENYRARGDRALPQAGLRCVIPLGRPRRQAP